MSMPTATQFASLWPHGYYDSDPRHGVRQITIWEFLIETLSRTHHAFITEIGCGRGAWSQAIWDATDVKVLSLVDVLPEECLMPTLRANNGVYYYRTDGPVIDKADTDFENFVFSFDTFCHFDYDFIDKYLGEVKRILEPGGQGMIMYADFEQYNRWPYRTQEMVPGNNLGDWIHIGQDKMKHLLHKNNLEPISMSVVPEARDAVCWFNA